MVESEKKVEEMVPLITDAEFLEEKKEGMPVDWDKVLARLEMEKEAFKRYRITILGYTRPRDWVIMDGVPYMEESGAQSVAGPMGVSFSEPTFKKEWMEDNKGKYYMYTCTTICQSRVFKRQIGAVGICTSRDKFFAMVGGELKALEDIDEKNIKMKSYTNMSANGIKRILGLRNVEIDELVRAGLDVDRISKVDHKLKGKTTGASEKAIEEAKKEAAAGSTEYTPKQIENAKILTDRIVNAKNMEELAKFWNEDQDKRRTLPEKLMKEIIVEKDKKKEWLQRQKKEQIDQL